MTPPAKGTRKSAKSTAASGKKIRGFTDEERAAVKERVREMKASEEGGESMVLAKIAEMPEPDRAIGKRLHAIILAAAPGLTPKTWYGMPAYAKEGHTICFYQNAAKFKARYGELGFSDDANLDDGAMWPTRYALKELTPAEEARIAALVKKAVS